MTATAKHEAIERRLRITLARSTALVGVGLLALQATQARAQAVNLVLNPSFEVNNGDTSQVAAPWVFTNGSQVGVNGGGNPGVANTGVAFARLAYLDNNGQNAAIGTISQTVAVPVSGLYAFSFFYASAGPAGGTIATKVNGTVVGTTTAITGAYQQFTQNVSLTAGAITFSEALASFNLNNPSAIDVDDFSIVALFAMIQNPPPPQNLTLAPNLTALAQTANQRAVATGLTNAFNNANLGTVAAPNGNAGAVVTALNNTNPAAIPGVLDSLSGEGIAAAQNVAHRSAELFTSSIFDQITFYGGGNSITLTAPQPGRGFQALAPMSGSGADTLKVPPLRELADLPAGRPQFIEAAPVAPVRTWRAWGTGFGADEDVRSNAAVGFAAQQNSIVGGSVGVDYQAVPGTLVGLAAGGTDGSFNVPNRATSGSTTGGHVAGYGLTSFGTYYGAASVSGSFFQNRTTRNVAGFGGLASETEKGSFSSQEVRARFEVGRSYASPYGANATITPFVALEAASLHSGGFTEQAIAGPGLFALNVAGQNTADVPAFVGLRFASVTALGNGMALKPVLQLAYVHDFSPERQIFAGINSLPGAVFLVDGARPSRNAAQVKAGGELLIGPRTAVFANFDGEFGNASQLYGGKCGIKIAF